MSRIIEFFQAAYARARDSGDSLPLEEIESLSFAGIELLRCRPQTGGWTYVVMRDNEIIMHNHGASHSDALLGLLRLWKSS